MSGVARPLIVVAQQVDGLEDGTRAGFAFASTLLMAFGETSLAWFTWQVFRRHQPWAKSL
jgi:hypothetical protein